MLCPRARNQSHREDLKSKSAMRIIFVVRVVHVQSTAVICKMFASEGFKVPIF